MKQFSSLYRIIVLAIIALAFFQSAMASAKDGEVEVYEGKTATVNLGAAYQRTLRNSTVIHYSWSSENTSEVVVTGSTRNYAIVKGVKATSSCKVYFKCDYVIDGFFRTMDFYYEVTVLPSSVSVTGIGLNRTSAEMTVGETLQLTATVSPSNATNKTITWSSNAPNIVSVNRNGTLTGISAGSAVITASSSNGKKATCHVTCKASVRELVISDKEGLADIPAVANIRYERSFLKGWNSVCLPFAFNTELLGLKDAKIAVLKEFETVGNHKYVSYQLVKEIEAGVPCLIYVQTDQNCKVTLKEIALVSKPVHNGLLKGTFTEAVIGSGCHKLTSDGKSFAVTKTSSAVCKPFRAYIRK